MNKSNCHFEVQIALSMLQYKKYRTTSVLFLIFFIIIRVNHLLSILQKSDGEHFLLLSHSL